MKLKLPEPARIEMVKMFRAAGHVVPLDIMSDDDLLNELDAGGIDISTFRNGTNFLSTHQYQIMVAALRKRHSV